MNLEERMREILGEFLMLRRPLTGYTTAEVFKCLLFMSGNHGIKSSKIIWQY